MNTNKLFERCKVWWWGGYYILVRNTINYRLEKKHLTVEEKEQYEKAFNHDIISDTAFDQWYRSIKKAS